MPKPNPKRIDGPFIAHRNDVLASDAWASLSLAARRVLDRLEIEHMAHAGNENGNLIVTYDQLVTFGIRRQSIRPAIGDLVAAGLVEITHIGRGGNAAYRDASRYRLTYLPTTKAAASDDWRRFTPSRPKAVAGAPVEQEA